MIDPRQADVNAIVQNVGIAQIRRENAINAYRHNIAMPDVHIAQLGDSSPVDTVGQDGQVLTFEMRQKLMEGKTPWVEDPECDRRELHSEEEVADEKRLGEAEIARRPGLRRVTPVELTDELMAQRQPATCVWSSGSDAGYDFAHISGYVLEGESVLVDKGRLIDCLVMSKEAAYAIDHLARCARVEGVNVTRDKRFLSFDVRFDDQQEHHLQVWAAGFPRLFASVFIHRELLHQLRQQGETQKLPVVREDEPT